MSPATLLERVQALSDKGKSRVHGDLGLCSWIELVAEIGGDTRRGFARARQRRARRRWKAPWIAEARRF